MDTEQRLLARQAPPPPSPTKGLLLLLMAIYTDSRKVTTTGFSHYYYKKLIICNSSRVNVKWKVHRFLFDAFSHDKEPTIGWTYTQLKGLCNIWVFSEEDRKIPWLWVRKREKFILHRCILSFLWQLAWHAARDYFRSLTGWRCFVLKLTNPTQRSSFVLTTLMLFDQMVLLVILFNKLKRYTERQKFN